MRVKVIAHHPGEGAFPTFAKGTAVTMSVVAFTDGKAAVRQTLRI
jgi:hypothetical protein